MNLSQTATALGLAQAFDQRTVGESDVLAWHSVLGDAPAEDVMEAIRRHYAEETNRIMPAHVRRLARDIARERLDAERATGWAPGQAGVPKGEALPEVTSGGAKALSDVAPEIAALISQLRTMLPEGSREDLMPRREFWKREHDAYQRSQGAEPNPHYKPHEVAMRALCRSEGPHDQGMHIDVCPDAVQMPTVDVRPERGAAARATGILPDAHRCADCSFVTADAARMDGHLNATGHVHE